MRWGSAAEMSRLVEDEQETVRVMSYRGRGGVASSLLAWSHIEGRIVQRKPLMKRMLQLEGNPLVQTLPKVGQADPVGDDLAEIPAIVRKIKEDWNTPEESLNRLSAFTLTGLLRKRMRSHEDGTHDGSLDVLITGCEVRAAARSADWGSATRVRLLTPPPTRADAPAQVSLWCGEQFGSDLHLVFPSLSVECISANKLLGLLGQGFPIPQVRTPPHSDWSSALESRAPDARTRRVASGDRSRAFASTRAHTTCAARSSS